MRLLKMTIGAFKSLRDTGIDFSKHSGLVGVEGRVIGSGADSNGCLHGDTLVDGPRDLTKYPAGIPLRELVGKTPWVYCWVDGSIAVRQASRVWLTHKKAKVYKVIVTPHETKRGPPPGRYSPPQELVGTYDHPVLLSDGTWRKLGELQPGDSVCSLYRRESGGWRTLLYWTGVPNNKAISEQQFVCGQMYGKRDSKHWHSHHKNENKYDHSVDNLVWEDAHEHIAHHTSVLNRACRNGWRLHGIHPRGMLGKHHSKEVRDRMSAANKGRKVSEETRAKLRALNKGKIITEEQRRAISAANKGRVHTKAARLRMSISQTGRKHSPATIAKMRVVQQTIAARRKKAQEERDLKLKGRINHTVIEVVACGTAPVYDMTVPGADNFVANGMVVHNSGKSSGILDAPCWCLYGKCIQDTDDANSVCNRQTGEADVTVVVELPNGKNATIRRTRRANKATLIVSGLAGGTVEGKQELVDEMLGIDYQLWTRVIAFGGSASSFCKLGDSEKKAALEKLLGLDDFSRARDLAAEKAKDCRDIVTKMESRREEADNTRITCADRLVKLQEDHENYSARMSGECFAAMTKVHELTEALDEGYDKLAEIGVEAAEESTQYEEEYKAWQTTTKQYKARIEKLVAEEKDTASILAVANSELSRAKQDLKHAQSDDHPDECPTCGQEWVANSSTKSLIQARKNALADALEKHAAASNVASRAEQATQKARGALSKHEDNEPSMGEKQAAFDSLKSDLAVLDTKLQGAKSEYERMVERSQSNPYLEQLQRCRDDLANAEMTTRTATEKADRAKADLALYDFWVAGFGKQGIPSFLIDNSIPFLNESMQRMVSLLTDGATSVHFDPTIEGGRGSRGGQQLGVVVDNQYGGGSYKTQSTGERARIDVCVLLAIRQLMATRLTHSFQQIFLDEVFDGLDSSGTESVAALLRSEFPDSTIYVITHDDRLKEHMDKTIVIEKRKGVSRVIKQ